MREHRFTTKDASDSHTVEPADEFAVEPCFNAVGDAHFMERRILDDHFGQDP